MTDAPNPRGELHLLVASRFPIVFVETVEEARADLLLVEIATREDLPLYHWSVTDGLVKHGKELAEDGATSKPDVALRWVRDHDERALYVFRDLSSHLTDDAVLERLLRDIARDERATVVLVGPDANVPDTLRPNTAVYALPRPTVDQIRDRARIVLSQLMSRGRFVNDLSEAGFAELVATLRGLTLEEVDLVLARLVEEDGRLDQSDVARAVQVKGAMLARGGVIELIHPEYGMEWVAGFDDLKAWLTSRAAAFRPDAASFGLTAPKGFLLTGVPGCGKSLTVKALAHDWRMPLLKLDAGALYDKFIGASERNLRQALQTAEALAPSVLWIDEIEKGFGTSGPSESDGGLGYRMLGTLATWMQERTSSVFVAATSNDITLLPPELTRQGRFDEIFFVDLPDEAERMHLFAIQLARRNRDYKAFDCAALAKESAGFSGAEIEQAVVNALYTAFGAQRDVQTQDVMTEIAATRPLAEVSPQKVQRIRDWGAQHARAV